jgi:hypothetical protein
VHEQQLRASTLELHDERLVQGVLERIEASNFCDLAGGTVVDCPVTSSFVAGAED